MARSVDIRVEARGLREFARTMGQMGERAFDRSQRRAVSFMAKDYSAWKMARIATDIDRPTTFTRRAYDWDRAQSSGDIVARSFVRPTQSRYLLLTETGGVRRTRGNSGPVGLKPRIADRFGGLYGRSGIRRRFLDRSATAPYATGDRVYTILRMRDRRTGKMLDGVFEKRKMGKRTTGRRRRAGKSSWRTRLIISFMPSARYRPRLAFARDARRYSATRFPALATRLFNDELRRLLARR